MVRVVVPHTNETAAQIAISTPPSLAAAGSVDGFAGGDRAADGALQVGAGASRSPAVYAVRRGRGWRASMGEVRARRAGESTGFSCPHQSLAHLDRNRAPRCGPV